MRFALVGGITEEPPEEEIWGGCQVRCQFHFSIATNEMFPKLFEKPCNVNRSTILQSLFLLTKVLTLLELSLELLKHWNVTLFYHCYCVTSIIFKEKWSNSTMRPMPCIFEAGVQQPIEGFRSSLPNNHFLELTWPFKRNFCDIAIFFYHIGQT